MAETVIAGQVPVDAGPTDRIVLNEATEADADRTVASPAKGRWIT